MKHGASRRCGLVAAMLVCAVAWTADAAVLVVDSAGVCSLYEAVINSNDDAPTYPNCPAGDGPDEILVSSGTHEGGFSITGDLVIRGDPGGGTVIDYWGLDYPVVEVYGSGSVVTLERLTLTGGSEGLVNHGAVVTLSESTVTGNIPSGSYPPSGAVLQPVEGGDMTLSNSTIANNDGVGVFVWNGHLRVENSTISGNLNSEFSVPCFGHCWGSSTCLSAAVLVLPDLGASAEVLNSTIANNLPGNCSGAAIGGPVSIEASIISNPAILCGEVYSLGHNLDSDGSCNLHDPTDLANVDPLLGPLQDNGGPTDTHALLASSPAIDAIPSVGCATLTDQRGISRPRGSGCDIGAFERVPSTGPTCGIGPELALVVPLIAWARRGRKRAV